MEPQNWMWIAQLGQVYAFRLSGITGLNQNGLPVAVDPAKAQTKEVADLTRSSWPPATRSCSE